LVVVEATVMMPPTVNEVVLVAPEVLPLSEMDVVMLGRRATLRVLEDGPFMTKLAGTLIENDAELSPVTLKLAGPWATSFSVAPLPDMLGAPLVVTVKVPDPEFGRTMIPNLRSVDFDRVIGWKMVTEPVVGWLAEF
jgi:hypothetical protein